MRVLYLCGAGNSEGVRLALNINRLQNRWDRIVLLDDNVARRGEAILDVEIAGPISMLADADPETAEVASLVARTTDRRWLVREKIEEYGLPFATLVDPTVDMLGAEVAADSIIYGRTTIGPEVSIDSKCVVFMGATIGHESQMGHCSIAGPHALLNARVELGEGAYVGSSATVLPEVKIGAWATVGAGSVAIRNVPDGCTVMGVPAKIVLTLDAKLKMNSKNGLADLLRLRLQKTGAV